MKLNLFASVLFASALGGACFAEGAPAGSPAGSPSAATAGAPGATAAATPLKHGFDPNTQICKWTDEIGTRLGRTKVCMTRAQWEQQSRDAQDDLNDTVHRSAEAGVPGG
jgi:hypothetical protein